MDAPNTTATISLPEGVELVKGELNGQWDLKANTPVYINATIRFLKAGDFQIKAAARRAIDANNFWGDVESLYLTIGPEASSFTLPLRWAGYPSIEVSGEGVQAEKAEGGPISIDPITLPMTQELPVASRGGGPGIYESTSIAAEPPAEEMPMKSGGGIDNATAPASPGALTIKGNWSYWGQDSIFRTNDGDKWLPCRTMLVEVVRASNLSQVLGAGHTNSKGAFSINITNDGSAFYVLLWTFTYYGPGYELRVVDPSNTGISGLNGVYYWYAGPFTSGDGTFNMGARAPDPTYSSYRACWLHQDLWRADDFLYKNGLDAYQATIAWAPTVAAGTYYTHGGQIHIAAGKEHASHVVIHEYGHNYMYREYGNYFPPFDCPTHWVENCYDNGCGWTEGWANFFCIAVNNDPVYRDPGFFFDFEPGDWDTPGYCDGPTCEGRVAGALWDIFDSNPDGIDLSAYSWGYKNISNVFVNGTQNIFADFWNQWRSYGYSNDAAHCLWQNTIDPGINLRPNTAAAPTGPVEGETGTSYAFSTSAIDPRDGNNVRFTFDWGDGTYTTTGYVLSGATASASHVWNSAGTKIIKANATDSNNLSSYLWSDQTTTTIEIASGWKDLGGFITSNPFIITDSQGRTHIFARGGDNALWLNLDGTWQSLGGVITSDPFAIKDSQGTIHVLVRGADNALWDRTVDGGWTNLGGIISSNPSAALSSDNHIKVAVKGEDSALWMKDISTGSWTALGGVITSNPQAILDSSGRMHVMARGGDNSLWDNIDGSWISLGGIISSDPKPCLNPANSVHIYTFVQGGDSSLWRNDLDTSTNAASWHGLGGVISPNDGSIDEGNPAPVTDLNGAIHAFVQGADGALWDNADGAWQGLGRTIKSSPSAMRDENGWLNVAVVGGDDSLWVFRIGPE